jgi:hypothetical protein
VELDLELDPAAGRLGGPPHSRRPKAQISKTQVMLPLTPERDNRLFTKERRRNVAAVRRRLRISAEVGRQRAPQNASAAEFPVQPHNREKPRRTTFLRLFYAAERLTKTAAKAYITFLRRAAAWRDGASTKPLTVHAVTEHRAMHVAVFGVPASKVRASAPSPWATFSAIFQG